MLNSFHFAFGNIYPIYLKDISIVGTLFFFGQVNMKEKKFKKNIDIYSSEIVVCIIRLFHTPFLNPKSFHLVKQEQILVV